MRLLVLICFVALAALRVHTEEATESFPSEESNTEDPPEAETTTAKAKSIHSIEYELHANSTLNEASRRIQKIYNRRYELYLNMTTKGRGYNALNRGPIKQSIENDYRRLVYEVASNLSRIPVDALADPLLRRQVQRLSKLQLYGLEKREFEEAKEQLHRMQTFATNRVVCPPQQPEDCANVVAMVPFITGRIMHTKKVTDLDNYWIRWRKAMGSPTGPAKLIFTSFVRNFRLAANYNGHVTPSRTWYLDFETENFQRELENVVWEIMPLYRELHAYLRHCARAAYKDRGAQDDGAINAPVIEQFLQQAWHPYPAFVTPHPNSHLPTVKGRLEAVMVTPTKITLKAAEFFESLGLRPMSNSFFERYSKRITDEESGHDCRSEVYYFPPNVALRYCPKLDYKKLMQMHGLMAELQYNIYKMELPYGLDREPCPGFGSAIGEAAVIASGTPRHLNRLHILYEESLSEEQSLNRLFRMGLHTLLAIPQYFVNEKFLVDVMDGRIGGNELNCGYWRLQYKYAGVVPPLKRTENNFDPDYKFYKGLSENSNTKKLISEVLGFQFYRSFCLASEQYRPGIPGYPLHNCDFHNSTKAGDLMKNMMRLGATKHWRDVMEVGTGERRLSGKGVLEYFAPLYTWLKDKNQELGLEAGWDGDLRCKSD